MLHVMCVTGWAGSAGVGQWNGQWPPQSTYWTGPYNCGNQTYGYAEAGQQPLQRDIGCVRPDQTPPPPHQEAMPHSPTAVVEEHGVHQPRIQQYCQAGYGTQPVGDRQAGYTTQPVGDRQAGYTTQPVGELSLPQHTGKSDPSAEASYSEAKAHQNSTVSTQHNILPLNDPDRPKGLLPVPSQLQQHLEQPVGQYGQSWEGKRETECVQQPPARKRRSRWEEQQPAGLYLVAC